MKDISILHNTTTIGKSSLGIGQISVSLAQAQHSLNHNVEIWCLDKQENIIWASENHGFPSEYVSGFDLKGPKQLWYSSDLKKSAHQISSNRFDIVHQHGIWTGASSASLIFAKKKKIPTVVAPHGSLSPWVLNLSRWKKKIALAMYEEANLRLASTLHATSENEISDFRDFGLKNPIAYIQNGIQEKYLRITGNANRFREQYQIDPEKRILFFLSRISPKKGLIMLINAIDEIKEAFDPWVLIIAGIDEFDHQKEIESEINKLGLSDRIKIIGPLFNEAKNDAFASSELFILPSHSEGSPMVVLDSLAAGVPVITTKASSWKELNDYHCGWWTEINSDSIAKALREAIKMTRDDLQIMGENGKKLIAEKYTWTRLAQKTLMLYNWILKNGDKPDFVLLD